MVDIISAFMSDKEYICHDINLGYPFLSVAGLFVRFGAISIQLFTSQVLVVKLLRL